MLTNAKPVILLATVKKEESRNFYEEVLGLEFVKDDGFALVFNAGGNILRISSVQEFVPHNFSILAWEVEDIASEIKVLAEKGVKFEIYDFPWMKQDELGIWAAPDNTKVAWFKDPDGNLLSLVQGI